MMGAGRAATADGSVLVARSCDALGDYAQQVIPVPRKRHDLHEKLRVGKLDGTEIAQVPETDAYVGVMSVLELHTIIAHCNTPL
jgi:dipeptidase